jgi:hypothetical protein
MEHPGPVALFSVGFSFASNQDAMFRRFFDGGAFE